MIHLVYTSLHICDIGVGAGPAGLVLAGPLFTGGGGGGGGGLMKFITDNFFLEIRACFAHVYYSFKSSSFAPV